MKRHRSTFDPKNKAPYELSRSRIENYVRCPACFYLQQVKAVPFPSIAKFLEILRLKAVRLKSNRNWMWFDIRYGAKFLYSPNNTLIVENITSI